MRVAVVGTGYVGLVTGAGLADIGVDVVCIDVDTAKITALEAGQVPFYEPGLDELLQRNVKGGRLRFSGILKDAVAGVDVVMLAVGTPPAKDGSADLTMLLQAAGRAKILVRRLTERAPRRIGRAGRELHAISGQRLESMDRDQLPPGHHWPDDRRPDDLHHQYPGRQRQFLHGHDLHDGRCVHAFGNLCDRRGD